MDVDPLLVGDLGALFVALVLAAAHVEDVLGGGLPVGGADFLDGFLVDLFELLLPGLVGALLEDEVVHAAGEAVHLHVVEEELVEAGHEFASGGFSVHFNEGVQEAVVRVGAHLVLVDEALQEFVVHEHHLRLLLVALHVVLRDLGRRSHRQPLLVLVAQVREFDDHLDDVADQLLSRPELLGLLDGRREQEDPEVLGLVVEEGEGGLVEEFAVVHLLEEAVLHGEVDCGDDGVLHDFPEGFAVGGVFVELVADAEFGLRLGHVGLEGVEVHLVAVEVGVVALAVGVVHAEGGLLGEDLHAVRHESGLVEGGLAVEEHVVAGLDVPVHDLVLVVVPQVAGVRNPLLLAEAVELGDLAVLLDEVGARVLLPVDDVALQLLQVVLVDVLAEREFLGHEERDADLVGVETGVGRDDGAGGEVDSLAHHLHAEEALLLLEDLADSLEVPVLHAAGLAGVDEAVDGVLQFQPLVDEVGLAAESPEGLPVEVRLLEVRHLGVLEVLLVLEPLLVEFLVLLHELPDEYFPEVVVGLHDAGEDAGVVVQVLLLAELALRPEPAGGHEHRVDEEHGEGVGVAVVAEHHLHQLRLVLPQLPQLVVDFLRGHEPLLQLPRLLLDLRMRSGLSAAGGGVPGLLAEVGGGLLLLFLAVAVDEEDLVGALLLDAFAFALAVEVGALVLGEPHEELGELAEQLDGGGGGHAVAALVAVPLHLLRELDPALHSVHLRLPALLGPLGLALALQLVQLPAFLVDVDIEVFVGLLDAVLPEEFQQHHVVLLDAFADPEAVAVEAAHAEELEEDVDDEGVVGGDDEFDVAGVAGALESLVAAGGADGVAVVGRDAEQGVVESAAQRPLLLVVDLGLVDLADAESPQLVGEDEPELDL